jgi:membrane protease YdiL (CAAX protease family)
VILFGAMGGVLVYLLWPFLGLEDMARRLDEIGLAGWKWPAFLAYFALGGPILEELFWRGLLLRPARGVDRYDVLFALYHVLVLWLFLGWGWILLAVVSLVVAGWWWRRIALAQGGLLLPVLSHLAAGIGISAALWLRTGGSLPG